MPLLDLVILTAVFIGVGGFCVYKWHAPPKRPRPVRGVDPAAIERLGEPLAAWCVRTQELAALLELFREQTETMLAQEYERRDWPRGPDRQLGDVHYLVRIREARSAGEAWIGEAAALPEIPRRLLREQAIDPEALRESFAFPWGLSAEHDRKRDRSDELETILRSIDAAHARLVAIDERLSTLGASPYR